MLEIRPAACIVFAGLLLLLAQSGLAKPITHEDVWLMPRVGSGHEPRWLESHCECHHACL